MWYRVRGRERDSRHKVASFTCLQVVRDRVKLLISVPRDVHHVQRPLSVLPRRVVQLAIDGNLFRCCQLARHILVRVSARRRAERSATAIMWRHTVLSASGARCGAAASQRPVENARLTGPAFASPGLRTHCRLRRMLALEPGRRGLGWPSSSTRRSSSTVKNRH